MYMAILSFHLKLVLFYLNTSHIFFSLIQLSTSLDTFASLEYDLSINSSLFENGGLACGASQVVGAILNEIIINGLSHG